MYGNQLLLALRFYALRTMVVSVTDFVGVSKSLAGPVVADVSSAIAKLYPKYIYIHTSRQQHCPLPRISGSN